VWSQNTTRKTLSTRTDERHWQWSEMCAHIGTTCMQWFVELSCSKRSVSKNHIGYSIDILLQAINNWVFKTPGLHVLLLTENEWKNWGKLQTSLRYVWAHESTTILPLTHIYSCLQRWPYRCRTAKSPPFHLCYPFITKWKNISRWSQLLVSTHTRHSTLQSRALQNSGSTPSLQNCIILILLGLVSHFIILSIQHVNWDVIFW